MKRRRRRSGGGGFVRGGAGLRGFASKEVATVVGGAIAGTFLAPLLANMLPDSMKASVAKSPFMAAGVGIAVGAVGYLLLSRFSKTAALGWVAATVAPTVMAVALPAPAGVKGWGSPEGLNAQNVAGMMEDEAARLQQVQDGSQVSGWTDEQLEY